MMIGWLGDAYPWVKAAHVILVIFWVAGLFMLPRLLVYHMANPPGSEEDARWVERERRITRIILNPGIVAVWLLGIMLGLHLGFAQWWLLWKMLIVLGLSGYHGWLSATAKKFARGNRPYAEKTLRLLNEVPALATILIVILVVVKPW
jgi:putative membrane protein